MGIEHLFFLAHLLTGEEMKICVQTEKRAISNHAHGPPMYCGNKKGHPVQDGQGMRF
jgi:hypothetical protein